jgi:hypothetical protein
MLQMKKIIIKLCKVPSSFDDNKLLEQFPLSIITLYVYCTFIFASTDQINPNIITNKKSLQYKAYLERNIIDY